MAKKRELLEGRKKPDLVKLARKVGETKVKSSMRKGEIVEALANSRKLKKSHL